MTTKIRAGYQPKAVSRSVFRQADNFLTLPTFTGPAKATYFCDAGCRPNPGRHLPVVWNGVRFLPYGRRKGTNHTAAYHAVELALEDAIREGRTHVELYLTSPLVHMQLVTRAFCRNPRLARLREKVASLAEQVAPVRLRQTVLPGKTRKTPCSSTAAIRKLLQQAKRQRSGVARRLTVKAILQNFFDI